MKLSSKSRYGLRAMCYMAEKEGQGAISVKEIADSIGVSEKYLEQLMTTLRKSNLIEAVRGANGGYYISRSLQEISVGEILRALEDGLMIVECISGDCVNKCGHTEKCDCSTHDVWNKLYKAINGCLDDISLASVIAR